MKPPLTPRLLDLPIHFDCEVRDEVRLGTHILFLGEVRAGQTGIPPNPQVATLPPPSMQGTPFTGL